MDRSACLVIRCPVSSEDDRAHDRYGNLGGISFGSLFTGPLAAAVKGDRTWLVPLFVRTTVDGGADGGE
jgi:hypothetical protein